jgi:hypothetical protein
MVQENSLTVQPEEKTLNLARILAILAILLIIGMAVSIGTWVNTYQSLTATVEYDGTVFIIHNGDSFQWSDVRLLLNSDFKFNTSDILPDNGFSVNASQFAKDDGTKFDPAGTAPTDLYITAKISKYGWSSWFYKFN